MLASRKNAKVWEIATLRNFLTAIAQRTKNAKNAIALALWIAPEV